MGFAFIKHDTNIDFIGKRLYAYIASALLIAVGIGYMVLSGGPKLGIDFAGGVVVQVRFAQAVDDNDLKAKLDTSGLPGLTTQRFGNDGVSFLLRFSTVTTDAVGLRGQVEQALATHFPGNTATIERLEQVGPKVGDDLTNKALEAMYYSVLLIAVYISGRFEQRWMVGALMAAVLWGGMYGMGFTGLGMGWLVLVALGLTVLVCWKLRLNFALGAIVGLLHDVVTTLGILALLGREIDLNVVAALLTLVGYSLNDTIIVYDRVRENLRTMQDKKLDVIINTSVNQTLSRTLLTSGTTFAATFALFALGGGVIHDFALTMLLGVIIGTFSSVYVSSAILLALGDTADYAPKEEEVIEKPGEHGIV